MRNIYSLNRVMTGLWVFCLVGLDKRPFETYFSLYRVVSQRKKRKKIDNRKKKEKRYDRREKKTKFY